METFNLSNNAKTFTLKRIDKDSFLLKVNNEKIYISIPSRVGFYREGIIQRINSLKKTFYSENIINEYSTVIDIGSNIGEYAISFPESVIVHAFEMDPNVIPSLILNCKGRENIKIHRIGLWNKSTTKEMFVKSDTADTSLIDNGSSEKYIINCERLDDIDSIKEIDEITMIKCDAEGAEPEVFSGAINTLKKTKFVAIDCGPERGLIGDRTNNQVKEILLSLDFEILEEFYGPREILVAKNNNLT